jgi:hypothetical protein
MSRLLALALAARDDLIQAHLAAIHTADALRITEHQAATRIQGVYRGHMQWKRYQHTVRAIILIQCVVRSHISRIRVQQLRRDRNFDQMMAKFNSRAAKIQSIWKGFRERALRRNDYYAMKAYLASIEVQNMEMRMAMAQHEMESSLVAAEEEEQKRKKELSAALRSSHHLLGTSSIAGVYKPPHARAAPITIDGGKDVEAMLKHAFHENMEEQKSNTSSRERLGRSLKAVRTGFQLKGPSVQAASKYTVLEETRTIEKAVDRKLCVGEPSFRPTRTNPPLRPVDYVNIGNPYQAVAVVMREEDRTRRIAQVDFIPPASASRKTFDGQTVLDSRSSLVKRMHAASQE